MNNQVITWICEAESGRTHIEVVGGFSSFPCVMLKLYSMEIFKTIFLMGFIEVGAVAGVIFESTIRFCFSVLVE